MFLRWAFPHLAAAVPGGAIVQFTVVWGVTFGLSYLLTAALLAIPGLRVSVGGVSWPRPHGASPASTSPAGAKTALPSRS